MEEDVEQAAASGCGERGPPRVAAAGTRSRPTAAHLGVEQMQGSEVLFQADSSHLGLPSTDNLVGVSL